VIGVVLNHRSGDTVFKTLPDDGHGLSMHIGHAGPRIGRSFTPPLCSVEETPRGGGGGFLRTWGPSTPHDRSSNAHAALGMTGVRMGRESISGGKVRSGTAKVGSVKENVRRSCGTGRVHGTLSRTRRTLGLAALSPSRPLFRGRNSSRRAVPGFCGHGVPRLRMTVLRTLMLRSG
jgi:hypothetical protein